MLKKRRFTNAPNFQRYEVYLTRVREVTVYRARLRVWVRYEWSEHQWRHDSGIRVTIPALAGRRTARQVRGTLPSINSIVLKVRSIYKSQHIHILSQNCFPGATSFKEHFFLWTIKNSAFHVHDEYSVSRRGITTNFRLHYKHVASIRVCLRVLSSMI